MDIIYKSEDSVKELADFLEDNIYNLSEDDRTFLINELSKLSSM